MTAADSSSAASSSSSSSESSGPLAGESRRPLEAIFNPSTVAVIGATEKQGSVGRAIIRNLIASPFGGTVLPINPKRSNVLGIKAYPAIGDVPEQVDLAVIVTPAPTVPGIIQQCADKGVKGVIVLSAGFKEIGEDGAKLETQVVEVARKHRIPVIGPNCLGVMRPPTGLNATFAHAIAKPGKVGFISQSGALCTAVLDWSLREGVGFSAFISIGSMADVGWGQLIDYLGEDPHTQSIVIYMESIGDARSFLSAAREVALRKPIILIKAGRSDAAAQAAVSHTGALTGSDDVIDVALKRAGVLRVDRIADLFYMAEVLSKQPRPSGRKLTIVTNAGGPGVLATDALIGDKGELTPISDQTLSQLNEILPGAWSHGNPIDVLGDADAKRYADACQIAAQDPNADGLLVVLTPQAMTDPTGTARQLQSVVQKLDKPILASWMGGEEVERGEALLNEAGVPTFAYPDTAAHIFNYMWHYASNISSLYETPDAEAGSYGQEPDRQKVADLLAKARSDNQLTLSEHDAKQVLSIYHIPVVQTEIARSADEAAAAAAKIDGPVVVKLLSKTITHKTDVGGVILNLRGEEQVRDAFNQIQHNVENAHGKEHFDGVTVQQMVSLDGFELILGSSIDPQFGPVLLFGSGGAMVEIHKDRALGLPPLNTTLARRMMERTHIFAALKDGARGKPPVDMIRLAQTLVRFSQLVIEQPWIKEIDINPMLVSGDQIIALDARIVVHDADTPDDKLPLPAIRPYPTQYRWQWTMENGVDVTLRPIRPEDEPLMVKFHHTLSERSVHFRYCGMLNLDQRVAHERLTRVCFNDYDREIALVAVIKTPDTQMQQIVGVGRLTRVAHTRTAEFAIIISDDFQGHGLGSHMLQRLVEIGRAEGLSEIRADIMATNREMQHLCEKQGFELDHDIDDEMVRARITL